MISQFFEQQMELEWQQREGGDGANGAIRHGRRSTSRDSAGGGDDPDLAHAQKSGFG